MDLADRFDCSDCIVYETPQGQSFAVDERGRERCVTRHVDRLYSGRHPMLVAGDWGPTRRGYGRRWQVTAYGHLILTAAGNRRPAIDAGVAS